jgi:hypothetical protein
MDPYPPRTGLIDSGSSLKRPAGTPCFDRTMNFPPRSRLPSPGPHPQLSGQPESNPMDDNLFSHPAESEHVATKHDQSSEPVQNPVFSDKQK